MKYIDIKVKKLYMGNCPVRDRYIEQAKREKKGLRITCEGETMELPFGTIKQNIAYVSKKTFRDKFSNTSHYLYYLKWIPQHNNQEGLFGHDFAADVRWFDSL